MIREAAITAGLAVLFKNWLNFIFSPPFPLQEFRDRTSSEAEAHGDLLSIQSIRQPTAPRHGLRLSLRSTAISRSCMQDFRKSTDYQISRRRIRRFFPAARRRPNKLETKPRLAARQGPLMGTMARIDAKTKVGRRAEITPRGSPVKHRLACKTPGLDGKNHRRATPSSHHSSCGRANGKAGLWGPDRYPLSDLLPLRVHVDAGI